jgi:hypothetical protein
MHKRTKIVLTTWHECKEYPSLLADIRGLIKKYPIIDSMHIKKESWMFDGKEDW